MAASWRVCCAVALVLVVSAVPACGSLRDEAELTVLAIDGYEGGDYACAAQLLERAIQEDPGNVELYKYLGYALTGCVFEKEPAPQDPKHIRFDPADVEAAKGALDAFLTYYQRGGKDPRLPYYLDRLFRSVILEKESSKVLDERTKAHPDDANYWRWLSKVDDDESLVKEAFEASRRWYLLEPDSEEAYLETGRLFLRECLYSATSGSAARKIVENNIRRVTLYRTQVHDDAEVLSLLVELFHVRGWYLAAAADRAQNARIIEELTEEMRECPPGPEERGVRDAFKAAEAFPEYLPMAPPSYLREGGSKADSALPMGSIRPPSELRQATPRYPAIEMRAGESGSVDVEITIDPDGMVSSARILKGATPPFDFAALDAARRFKYARPFVAGPGGEVSFVSVYWLLRFNFKAGR